MWGMNYHRPSDSVVGLSIDGTLFALDRTTGAPTAAPLQLPCSPAKGNDTVRPPAWAVRGGPRRGPSPSQSFPTTYYLLPTTYHLPSVPFPQPRL